MGGLGYGQLMLENIRVMVRGAKEVKSAIAILFALVYLGIHSHFRLTHEGVVIAFEVTYRLYLSFVIYQLMNVRFWILSIMYIFYSYLIPLEVHVLGF